MVDAKAPSEVIDALSMIGENAPLGRPLFAKLVPYSVHIAASIYVDRRDRLVNQTIIGELESMTLKLREYAIIPLFRSCLLTFGSVFFNLLIFPGLYRLSKSRLAYRQVWFRMQKKCGSKAD
jgi:hypothetical protein